MCWKSYELSEETNRLIEIYFSLGFFHCVYSVKKIKIFTTMNNNRQYICLFQ